MLSVRVHRFALIRGYVFLCFSAMRRWYCDISGSFETCLLPTRHHRCGPNSRMSSRHSSFVLSLIRLLSPPSQPQEGAGMGIYPSSPTPAIAPVSNEWEDEKHAARSGTPRSGAGTDATGAAWTDRRRSLGESVSSMPSDGDSADVAQGSVGEQLFYVHQLRERMSKEQIEMRSLIRLVFVVALRLHAIHLSPLDGLSDGRPSALAILSSSGLFTLAVWCPNQIVLDS